jgi:glutamate carboxypeptidase
MQLDDADRQGMGEAYDAAQGRWLELLERLVGINSFSDNLAGIDAVRAALRPELERLGFTVEEPLLPPVDSVRPRAAHLVARRTSAGAPRALLIAHLDTVFPPGVGLGRLARDGDVLRGPGVGDIKGGVVAILAALDLMRQSGSLDEVDVTVFLNSDEEAGSHSSRDLLRRLAKGSDVALGFEPAFCPAGEPVTAPTRVQHVLKRKGCGRWAFRLKGVAAHSGGAHQQGVSAIEGLARKILDIHALTDDARGITTNVGLCDGGRSANTVAPDAGGEVDFRYQTAEDGEVLAGRIREIVERPELVNARLATPVTGVVEPGGGALWPPLLPTPDSERLSRLIVDVSAGLGVIAEPITRGGASDAAHAAAVGVPAICGLGPLTAGIHTDDEHSSASGLKRSSLVAAALLLALGDADFQRARPA